MSAPKTWMPSGLRTPVASISVRVWIGIHQTLGMPGKCSVASSLRDQRLPGHARAPVALGRELHDRLDHPERRRIGRRRARPALPNTRATSGNLFSSRSIRWSTRGARSRTCRGGGRHVEQRPFVERRHELAAEPARHRDGRHDERAPPRPRPASGAERRSARPARRRVDQGARDGVLLLAADAAADEERRERRRERDREHRREAHRVGLGEGERLEEPPLGPLQREHRQERDGDHEQREEDRPADLLHRRGDHLLARGGAPGGLPVLEPLVDVLDDDDRRRRPWRRSRRRCRRAT